MHTITIEPMGGSGLSVPFVFRATCSCGAFSSGFNAYKWVALEIQWHYINSGMTNGRGLLVTDPEEE